MIVVAGLIAFVTVLLVWALVKVRAHNQRLNRLRSVTPMRYRRLNVVNPCDLTAGCHAGSHEPSCTRGRTLDADDDLDW